MFKVVTHALLETLKKALLYQIRYQDSTELNVAKVFQTLPITLQPIIGIVIPKHVEHKLKLWHMNASDKETLKKLTK